MTTLRIDDAQLVADGRVRRASVLIDGDGRIGSIIEDGQPKPSADSVVDASNNQAVSMNTSISATRGLPTRPTWPPSPLPPSSAV